MLQIRDDLNTLWFVDKDDPAGELCRRLSKAGFEEIALPRQAILTGCVTEDFDTSALELACAGLSLLDGVGKRVRQDLISKAEHQARVFLCWRALSLTAT